MTDEEIKAEYEILDRAKQNPAAFIVGARLQRVPSMLFIQSILSLSRKVDVIVGARLQRVPSMLFIQSILSLSRKVDVETTYHSIVEQVNLLDPVRNLQFHFIFSSRSRLALCTLPHELGSHQLANCIFNHEEKFILSR